MKILQKHSCCSISGKSLGLFAADPLLYELNFIDKASGVAPLEDKVEKEKEKETAKEIGKKSSVCSSHMEENQLNSIRANFL